MCVCVSVCVCDPWSRQNLTGHSMCVLCVYTTNQNWPVYTREKKPQTIKKKKKHNERNPRRE